MISEPKHTSHIGCFHIHKLMGIGIFLKNVIKYSHIIQILRNGDGKNLINLSILFGAKIQVIVEKKYRTHEFREQNENEPG